MFLNDAIVKAIETGKRYVELDKGDCRSVLSIEKDASNYYLNPKLTISVPEALSDRWQVVGLE